MIGNLGNSAASEIPSAPIPCSATAGLLTEGPRWHAEAGELLWVDILGATLHRLAGTVDAAAWLATPDHRCRTLTDRSSSATGEVRRARQRCHRRQYVSARLVHPSWVRRQVDLAGHGMRITWTASATQQIAAIPKGTTRV